MTTDLTTLSALISAVADWDAGDTPPSHLLETVFEVLSTVVPQAQTLRLYRILGGYLIELGANETVENTVTDTNKFPILAKVLESQAPTSVDNGRTWYYAPNHAGRQVVLVELSLTESPSQPETLQTWVKILGDKLQVAIQHRTNKVTVQRQALVTSRIANATTFTELAQAIAKNILSRSQFVALNIYRFNEQGNIVGIRIIAAANNQEAFDLNIDIDLNMSELSGRLQSLLLEGKRQIFPDLQAAADVADAVKYTLDGTPIVSSVFFPMVVQGNNIGVVTYNDVRTTIDLSDDELDLMQSIADQTGAVISLRNMAETTFSVRQAVDNIVAASRLIGTSTDYGQMAQAVMRTLAQGLTGACITLFDKPIVQDERPNAHYLVGVGTPDSVQELDEPFSLRRPSPEQLHDLHAGHPVIVSPEQVPLLIPDAMKELLNLGNQEWMAAFGLRVRGFLIGTLSVASKTNVNLSDDLKNAYVTLADQIGLSIRSRQLLRESEDMRAVASRLIYAEQAIAEAADYTDMSRIVLELFPLQVHGVGLVVFDRTATADELPSSMVLESYVTRTEAVTPRVIDTVDPDFPRWRPGLQTLTEGQFVFREQVDPENSVSPNAIRYYVDRGTTSLITIGLRAGRRLVGLMVLSKEPNYKPHQGQLDNIRAIADQVGVTLDNRRLLRQTEYTLKQTQSLYAVNRDLINVQNEVDIVRVIYRHVVPDSQGVVLVRVPYEASTPQSLVIENVYDGKFREIQKELSIENLSAFLSAQSRQALSLTEALKPTMMEAALLRAAGLADSGSAILIPAYDEDRLSRLIVVGYTESRQFDESFQNMLNAVRVQVEIVLQNQRLLVEMQKAAARLGSQVRVLQTLNHMSNVVTSASDQQTLFDNTVEAMYNALGVDHVGLALYNPQNDTSTVISEYPKDGAIGVVIGMDDSLQTRLRSEKLPIQIDSVNLAQGLDPRTRTELGKLGIKSLISLPLLDSDDKFIGSIGLDFKSHNSIRPETADIARTMTSQITVALQNVRLLEASRHQAERMEQIATFSRAVQGSLDVDELLKTSIQNVREIVASDYCALILYDALSGRPRRVGWQEGTSRVVISLQSGPFADLPATTSGVVWKGQDAIIVPDHRAAGALQFAGSRHVLSSLSVPIFSRGVLRGVMELGNNLQNAYSTTDRFILLQLVNQLAVAIENAEAYRQSQRVAQSKALVNDISVKLQQQTSMEQILNVTMNELGRALQAKRGRIRLTPDALLKDEEREDGA